MLLCMGLICRWVTEHLTDAIAETTNYFVVFFEKLLEGLTWGNVLFQLCVIWSLPYWPA